MFDSRRRGRLLALALTATAALATAAAADASTLTPPRPAGAMLPNGARDLGAVPANARVHAMVALVPRQPKALAAYARAVATPGSLLYRQYLTVAQFRRRFAPSAAKRARVRAALRRHGLDPGRVTANGLSIPVTTTAAAAAGAFSTALERFRLPDGRTGHTTTTPARLGDGTAGLVQAIVGLDTVAPTAAVIVRGGRSAGAGARRPSSARAAPRAAANVASAGPQPCLAARAIAAEDGSYTADQIASAYGLSNFYAVGDEGRGVTIALYELEPFAASDVAAYQSCYGTGANVTVVGVDGGAGAGFGSGEAAMDVEDVIGLAPQADIRVYEGPPTGAGAYDTYSRIVSDDAAQVVSTSWGLCEALEGTVAAQAESTLFQEAAVQGQSFMAASGDLGSDDCSNHRRPAVDDPASQPWVTAVGGTSLSASGDAVWNDALGAGGGGASRLWSRPAYQDGFAQPQSAVRCGAGGSACRELPDISADGDPDTGYVAYLAGAWHTVGGTSVAAPTIAALTALAQASGACAGHPLGLLNPSLYRAAGGAYALSFHDVTAGSNGFDSVPGFPAGPGYDMASGLGTPAAGLGPALCRDSVTLSTPAAQSWISGRSASLQLAASSAAGAPITYSAAALPPGMALDPSSGRIAGSPRSPGRYTVTVTAADADGATAAASFVAVVTAPPAAGAGGPAAPRSGGATAVRLSRLGARSGRVGVRVRVPVRAHDLRRRELRYAAAGLPRGLTVGRRSGLISGTPRVAGDRLVRLRVSDTGGAATTAVFRWRIAGRPRATVATTRLAAAGRARLSLRLTPGRLASAIRRAVIVAPRGTVRFLQPRAAADRAAVTVRAAGRRLRITTWVAQGHRAAARPGSLGLRALDVAVARAAAARFRARAIVLRITVTDVTGARTRLRVRV